MDPDFFVSARYFKQGYPQRLQSILQALHLGLEALE